MDHKKHKMETLRSCFSLWLPGDNILKYNFYLLHVLGLIILKMFSNIYEIYYSEIFLVSIVNLDTLTTVKVN